MNQAKALSAFVVLLLVLSASLVNLNAAQTSPSQTIDQATLPSTLPANVVWEKTYGGAADDRAFYSLPVGDGFLVVGSSKSIVADAIVGWALMLDGGGNALWNKTFLEGAGVELRYAVNLTDGFLLVGNEFLASGDINGYVAKIDNQGSLQWRTVVGGDKVDKLFSAVATSDGFAVFGLTYSSGNGESDVWAVKLEPDGNVVWNRTYGQSADSAARAAVLAPDGDYAVAGYVTSGSDDNCDFYLLKVDTDGGLVWNKTYGGVESEKAYSMTKAPDGYVLVGDIAEANSATDAWVVKVDFDGNMVWNKAAGGKDADSAAFVTPARDGGYLVAGFTFSFGQGQRDFWLLKISAQGQIQFSCTQGNEGFQEAYGIMETGDGKFVLVGWTDPVGQPDLIGKATYDFYVVKLDVNQVSNGPNFQAIAYLVTAFVALIVTLLLLLKLRWQRRRKQKLEK